MSGGAHDLARVADIAATMLQWEDALDEALGEADMYDERDAYHDGRITLVELRAIAFTKMVRAEDGVYGEIYRRIGESVEDACRRTLEEHRRGHPRKPADEEEGDG